MMGSYALDKHRDHIDWLVSVLSLGKPLALPEPVTGGFHHRMWQLQTDTGRYAVKQLGADVALNCADVAGHYNATEAAARGFAQRGIPALHALEAGGNFLHQRDGEAYLVYPWTEARALPRHRIDSDHACLVAAIMARMHRANIADPGLGNDSPQWLTGDRVVDLVQRARDSNVSDARELDARLEELVAITAAHPGARATLAQVRVVSHGDLDHKNVLWTHSGEPLLIDWESARRLNPTHEVLLEALDWSGITANFEQRPFSRFLGAYRDAGGVIAREHLHAAFDCVLADWVNWLMYNVGRSLEQHHPRQQKLGTEQVALALDTIQRIQQQLPQLLDLAAAQTRSRVAG